MAVKEFEKIAHYVMLDQSCTQEPANTNSFHANPILDWAFGEDRRINKISILARGFIGTQWVPIISVSANITFLKSSVDVDFQEGPGSASFALLSSRGGDIEFSPGLLADKIKIERIYLVFGFQNITVTATTPKYLLHMQMHYYLEADYQTILTENAKMRESIPRWN